MADQQTLSSHDSGIPLLLTELVVLISSEMIVNLILKENSQPKRSLAQTSVTSVNHDELKARGMQLLLLLVLLASYCLFLHAPYLIALGLCLVLLRLAFLRCFWVRNKNTSKTLRYTGDVAHTQSSNQGSEAFGVPFTSGTTTNHYRSPSATNHTNVSTVITSYMTTPPKPHVPVSPLYDTPPNMTPSSPPTRPIKTNSPITTWSTPYSRTPLRNLSSPLRSTATPSPMTTPPPQLSPPGIYNTGNICFLISSIHCLSSVEGFMTILKTSKHHKYRQFTESLSQIINHTLDWSRDYVSPAHFLHSVSTMNPHLVAPKGRGSLQTQQDAGEFILWLIDNLHSAYKQEPTNEDNDQLRKLAENKDALVDQIKDIDSRDPACYTLFREVSSIDMKMLSIRDMSEVYRLFCGQVLEARECQECRKMSINLEYHTILPLPVPYSTLTLSLVDCFNLFGEVETLSNEQNMLLCSYCSQDVSKMGGTLTLGKRLSMFSMLPNRLIIQLMRYSFDNVQQKATKKHCPINFPLTDLDLSPFTMETKAATPTEPSLYNLTGFCVHTGAQSTSYGHYIAYSKVKDGSWYQFNDHHVTRVRDIRSDIRSPFVSQNAYILFYTRK